MFDRLKPGLAYFALVFTAGFALGSIRVPFLVPRLGERTAELIETPFMFVAIVFAARSVIARFHVPATLAARASMGIVALLLLVMAELAMARVLSGGSIAQYIASRDPVSGSVYLAMLVLYAAMPEILRHVARPR
jgi:hypothetical protein